MSSDEEVASLWNSASLEWSALGVASEDLGEFLSSNVSEEMNISDNLEHTLSARNVRSWHGILVNLSLSLSLSLSGTHLPSE